MVREGLQHGAADGLLRRVVGLSDQVGRPFFVGVDSAEPIHERRRSDTSSFFANRYEIWHYGDIPGMAFGSGHDYRRLPSPCNAAGAVISGGLWLLENRLQCWILAGKPLDNRRETGKIGLC